jgi:hypothetical protein
MDGRVTVGTIVFGSEATMKARDNCVATVTEIRDFLERQHVTVHRTMRLMTGCAVFNQDTAVFEHERPLLIRMAVNTGGVFKACQAEAS